ncbi:MAG: hypothetical protein LZF62_230043 [Nitrospira sp.]|nr:MAG: hypothetical protein LZF62_230043 [Nitrospira sp.]
MSSHPMDIPSFIALVVGVVLFFYCVRFLIKLSLSLAFLLLVLTVGSVLSFILLPGFRSIVGSFRGV